MVRELSIGLAFIDSASRKRELSKEETYVTTLALAEHQKVGHPRVAGLSLVGLPFWLVQTSASTSIVLAPSSATSAEFGFTENPHVSDMRKTLMSGVSEPKDVPAAVDRLIKNLAELENRTQRIQSVEDPSALLSAADYVSPSSSEQSVSLIEGAVTSQDALLASGTYQDLKESISVRIKAMEELRSLADEKLGGQLSVIENIISTDERRYQQQLEHMQQTVDYDIEQLREKINRQVYSLREKLTMDLRARTADFARSLTQIESLLGNLLGETRSSQAAVNEKGEDVQGAVSVFMDFSETLRDRTSDIPEVVTKVESYAQMLLKSAEELREGFDEERKKAEAMYEEEVKKKRDRVEAFREEMDAKIESLRVIRDEVKVSLERLDAEINNRIVQLQAEFLDVTRISIENERIEGIAPLTRLTVNCAVITYPDGKTQLLFPYSVPDERIGATLHHHPVSRPLAERLSSSVQKWLKEDPTFANAFERAIREGNIFLQEDAGRIIEDGLFKLQASQRLQDGAKGILKTIWNRYSGKCPKCGVAVAIGDEFCPKCGATI